MKFFHFIGANFLPRSAPQQVLMSTIRGTGVGDLSSSFLDSEEFQQACSTKGKKKKIWDVSKISTKYQHHK